MPVPGLLKTSTDRPVVRKLLKQLIDEHVRAGKDAELKDADPVRWLALEGNVTLLRHLHKVLLGDEG
jgi:hypothetical protein